MSVVNIGSIDPSTSAISKAPECYGTTCINVANTRYTWLIQNFEAFGEQAGTSLTSPIFLGAGPNGSIEWNIILDPCNKTDHWKDYLAIYLQHVQPIKKPVRAKAIFSCINNRHERVTVSDISESSPYKLYEEGKLIWGSDLLMNSSELTKRNLLVNDNLTIVVDVSVVLNTVNIAGKRHTLNAPKSRILEDLSVLYETKKYCDVTLVAAGGQKFPAHKAILAARSPVFSAMFNHDMTETRSSIVEITDIDCETLAALLRYLYTDVTIELNKVATELIAAANKYDLSRLKILCEESLCNDLTIENVANSLVISEIHGAEHLKSRAIDLIRERKNDFISTVGYKSMLVKHPKLINEALEQHKHT